MGPRSRGFEGVKGGVGCIEMLPHPKSVKTAIIRVITHIAMVHSHATSLLNAFHDETGDITQIIDY